MTAGREEALRLDAYLERDVPRASSRAADAHALDADLRHAVDALRSGLVRVHPSFRFVEELSARLRREAEVLLRVGGEATHPAHGELVQFPVAAPDPHATRTHRAVLVRGAISGVSLAGVSLAGVAFVAWRRGRLTGSARRGGPLGLPSLPGGRA